MNNQNEITKVKETQHNQFFINTYEVTDGMRVWYESFLMDDHGNTLYDTRAATESQAEWLAIDASKKFAA